MHKKDFVNWHKLKVILDEEKNRPNILIREIRWCSIGHNVGSEIDGKGGLFSRPVIILKIISSNTCMVLPLTHTNKTGKHIFEFSFKGESTKARLDQVRIIDIKRIKGKIGRVSDFSFQIIKNKTKEFLFN